MNSVEIEKTHSVNHSFLRERVENGERPETKEFVSLIEGLEVGPATPVENSTE